MFNLIRRFLLIQGLAYFILYDMNITLKRIAKKSTYTIGRLYINGQRICDTIEDKDRGLTQSTSLAEIKRIKVPSETAIPTGTYNVTLKVRSPKFGQKAYYNSYCNGCLPRLVSVPGFDGILMHRGATAKDSAGCIILGYNTIVGKLTDSQKAFEAVYSLLKAASDKGERISITIE